MSEASLYILASILDESLLFGTVSRYDVGTVFLEGPRAYATKTSFSSHFKQLLLHTCYLLPTLMLTLFLPARIGHYLFPFVSRLEIRMPEWKYSDSESTAYIENMLFQALVPFVMDKIRFAANFRFVFQFFFKNVCQALDLNDCLNNNTPLGNTIT